MRKRLLLIIVFLAVLVSLGGAYILWWPSNPAKNEANRILKGFDKATSSKLYCENGDSGKGVDNDVAWAEVIYVTDEAVDTTAQNIYNYIDAQKYKQTKEFIENNQDGFYNIDETYWELEAWTADYSATTRVSETLTLNNCFENSKKDSNINLDNWNTKIVIKLRNDR